MLTYIHNALFTRFHVLWPRHRQVAAAAAATVDAPPAQQLDWDQVAAELETKSPLEIMDHVRLPARAAGLCCGGILSDLRTPDEPGSYRCSWLSSSRASLRP